jgi:ectoine hydroxylase-related dioxygenase (phytanoyl-CoA dioxygenase family)
MSDGVRLVTREEAAHLREHGWVKLKGLLSPDLAGELLERSKRLAAAQGTTPHAQEWWMNVYDPIQNDERFGSLGFSRAMGLNAQRLMQRSLGVLLYSNLLAVKIGAGLDQAQSRESAWHQDGTDTPIDRASWVRFWIALDHVTPQMGGIRFLDRAHRIGPIGNEHLFGADPSRVLLNKFPELAELDEAGPFEMQPGDATVHSMFTVHGAPLNTTSTPRWAFILSYMSDDTRYTASSDAAALLAKAEAAGLKRGDRFKGDAYPKVCDAIPTWAD